MRILVVDDSKFNRMTLVATLAEASYKEVVAVENADQAFRVLGLASKTAPPAEIDLILMDIEMPGVDGIEACRRIKADHRLREIPIIMVTAYTEVSDLQVAFAAGAMDYLTKPIKKGELLARIRSALTLKFEMDQRKARERELMEVSKQLAAANRALRQVASTDVLTGLANRRQFDRYLDLHWKTAIGDGAPVALIMADIDYFKAYNDSYGHPQGDECIRQVGNLLLDSFREMRALVARYGGEEFAVVLPYTELGEALRLAEQFQARLNSLAIPHASAPTGHVTISMGVSATRARPETSYDTLVSAADGALYQSKQQGRNRINQKLLTET